MKQAKASVNPFELRNDEMLEKISLTHSNCVETYDVEPLHSVASNIIKHSIEISEHITKNAAVIDQSREDEGSLSLTSFRRFPGLKEIAYLMTCTTLEKQYAIAHETTMLILEQLKGHSWDAKAVIAMAAFALEYGSFWHFATRNQEDPLEKSLAELNGVQNIQENKQHLIHYTDLVKKLMQVMEQIIDWKKINTEEFDIKDVPALSDTLQMIPVIVYWAIITFVACTSNINTLGDKGYKYELSKFVHKLDFILNNFKDHLDKCKEHIGAIKDYLERKAIFNVNRTSKDVVMVLKALIVPSEAQDSQPILNCLTGQKVGVEEFRDKYVLMFISGLDNIGEEIQLLKSFYEGLKQEPKEDEGYRKEDFIILWVPIVDDWNDIQKNKLEKILKDSHIGWYVVKEFNFSTGIRLMREIFSYKGNPIIPLISPEGKVKNPDGKQN